MGRVAWFAVWCVAFRFTPRLLFGWRRLVLRAFGATIGRNARISPSVVVFAPWNLTVGEEASIARGADVYCVAPITIGDHATVSQFAELCGATHDVRDPNMALVPGPIAIGPGAWVCAGAFIGPGVTLGSGAVAGARAVVVRDVPDRRIVAGNPARDLGPREFHDASSGSAGLS